MTRKYNTSLTWSLFLHSFKSVSTRISMNFIEIPKRPIWCLKASFWISCPKLLRTHDSPYYNHESCTGV
jgi:hypothetical protein